MYWAIVLEKEFVKKNNKVILFDYRCEAEFALSTFPKEARIVEYRM